MNVVAIPDYNSPIVGYRVWRLGEAELISLNGEPWLPGRPLEAGCRRACVGAEIPKTGCTCGVYAAKSFEHLIALFQYHGGVQYYGGVIGEVYLWGKVVEHDLGYRAQFAYPKSLAVPADIALEPSRWEP